MADFSAANLSAAKTATIAERNRLNTIIAGRHYNPAQWNTDFEKFHRITEQSLKNPTKYKPEEMETRAEDLLNRRFGALYSDLKEYFKDYKLPIINILSMFVSFIGIDKGILYDEVDYSKTDQEILTSLRLSLRQYADDHAKEIFGIDIQKNPEDQKYNTAPIPYKNTYDMPIDKINNDIYELLHTDTMKKKYKVSSPNNNPVWVTTILAPFIPEEEKREEIEKGIVKLKELSYSVDVLTAAYQLYRREPNTMFTAAQVFRVLQTEYKRNHNHVPETSEKEIEEILDAWYNMMIDIGAEEQILHWRKGDLDKAPDTLKKGNFFRVLPIAYGKAKYAAGEKKSYIYNPDGHIAPPPTLEYSQDVSKQIATFPDALLNPPVKYSGLSKTINTHLLEYIDAMKYRSRPNKILYTTLAHEIGYFRQRKHPTELEELRECLQHIPPQKKERLRNNVKKHLDYFVQQGFISSWEEYPKEGRNKDGVIITLADQQPGKKKGRKKKGEGE